MNTMSKLFKTQLGWALLAGVAFGAVGTVAFLNSRPSAVAEVGADASSLTQEELNSLELLNNASTKLVQQMMPSVVHVMAPNRGEGSGVVYRQDGYILTNAHVVGNSKDVKVVFADGREANGEVITDTVDPMSDIAVVKVNRQGLTAAKFADSSVVKQGQLAIAIGAPFGYAESVTFGHVSGLGRGGVVPDWQSPVGSRAYFNMIQTDAAINPGNSGGPLLNYKGEVMGINTAINSTTGASTGVGFAIPSNTARILADQLISKGKILRAYLGLVPASLLGFERQELKISEGAIVRSVEESGPAGKAGLNEGDVVTEIAGRRIRSEQDLRDAMLLYPPGQTVDVRANRKGKDMLFKVKLATRPAEIVRREAPTREDIPGFGSPGMPFGWDEEPTAPNEPRGAKPAAEPVKLGVQVRDLTQAERAEGPTNGVLVLSVEPGSPAARAGIKAGVIIMEVGTVATSTPDALKSALSKYSKGDVAQVTFAQTSKTGTVVVSRPVRF